MTAPLAFRMGSVGRVDNADTRLLIWNVAWVARTLVVDPLHVFDANIFYPHTGTLAYSESNLGAGALAIPVYWATRNPVAAHNFVLLLSFVLSATGTYYLVRYLTRDRRAAVVSAICFAYCPYVISHLPHIHLLMTAGLPFSMLAFHRLADAPTPRRGLVLGLAMAAEVICCGYYGVFVGLSVGFAVLVVAATRRRWADARYWTAVAAALAVTVAIALPLFLPYMRLQRATGFRASPDEARQWAASWRTYFASSAYAHRWMLPLIGHWSEVLFPGFVALAAGLAGLPTGWRARGRLREVSILYGSLGVLALWASAGPAAGLYRVLYATVPAFSLLRAPSRFGMIVAFALSVLAGVSVAALLSKIGRGEAPRRRTAAAVALAVVAAVELIVPLHFSPVPPVDGAYHVLATLPRGPVLEVPVYSRQFASERTYYMLSSTVHWMPLVDAYSSYIPQDFADNVGALAQFPSLAAFRILRRDGVRYAVFHLDRLSGNAPDDLLARIATFGRYLRLRYTDGRVLLYEIVDFPG